MGGSKVLEQISRDLQDAFPNVKGFSTTNLKYMRRSYEHYQDVLDDNTSLEMSAQAVRQISLNELAMVPWGHHRQIIINRKGDTESDLFWPQGNRKQLVTRSSYEFSGYRSI